VSSPPIPAVANVNIEGGWLLFDRPRGSVDVPPEVYLREFRDTDAGEIEQLAKLCSLGLIFPSQNTPHLDDLPTGFDPQLSSILLDHLASELEVPPFWAGGEDIRWRRMGGEAVHASEVALRVLYVQACTEHVLAYTAGEPVRQAWHGAALPRFNSDGDSDEDAWGDFIEVTDAALRDFHVHVSVEPDDGPSESNIGGMHATLYSVAMLQLVNDLAEHVPYLRCANENCGRLFARQRGRSEQGGNRMRGVIYCSSNCARAQYQREKRRRDRAVRTGVAR
jgi:hypothetical protein